MERTPHRSRRYLQGVLASVVSASCLVLGGADIHPSANHHPCEVSGDVYDLPSPFIDPHGNRLFLDAKGPTKKNKEDYTLEITEPSRYYFRSGEMITVKKLPVTQQVARIAVSPGWDMSVVTNLGANYFEGYCLRSARS